MKRGYFKKLPQKVYRQKNPTLSQAWKWAYAHDERRKKHWNFRMLDSMKAQSNSCVPYVLYKWKWFGFDCYRKVGVK